MAKHEGHQHQSRPDKHSRESGPVLWHQIPPPYLARDRGRPCFYPRARLQGPGGDAVSVLVRLRKPMSVLGHDLTGSRQVLMGGDSLGEMVVGPREEVHEGEGK